MTLLFDGMLFVHVSCESVSRYALIFRIEVSFGCGLETMLSSKVKLISWTQG